MARHAALAPTEIEFQAQVTHLAKILGWRCNHTRRSIGKGHRWVTATSIVGYPDLTLWNEKQQRVIFAELKTDKGVLTPEQTECLRSLEAAGQETYVWRPAKLEQIRDILTNPVRLTSDERTSQ